MHNTNQNQYQYPVGGTLSPEDPTYVQREADREIYARLKAGDFCYIFNSRQMGKSSLVVRVRSRLADEGYSCALIDLSEIGSLQVDADQWYASLVSSLADKFELEFDFSSWWEEHKSFTLVTRLDKFVEAVLLKQISKNIVIFIDEIDTILSLNFSSDDFFAYIRSCYNQRIKKSSYKRLSFVLIGVATPSALIKDKERTPFNLGRAIELHGFQLQEVKPLERGLEVNATDPKTTLKAILYWTDGQPFLTQKLCSLVQEKQLSLSIGEEVEKVEELVEKFILRNWESQDEPEHLRTIYQRIFRNRQNTSQLLDVYRSILRSESIPADNTPEQTELLLSGLVCEKDRVLKVYNRIYKEVFNEQWIQECLEKLRPYTEAMNAWLDSGRKDESRLLRGQALLDALEWAKNKQDLSEEDQQFLQSSREEADRISREISEQISKIGGVETQAVLQRYLPELESVTDDLPSILSRMKFWAGSQAALTEEICKLLVSEPPTQGGRNDEYIDAIVNTSLIQNWETQNASKHLVIVRDAILGDVKCSDLLQLYQRILRKENVIADDSAEQRTLLKLGLIENQDGKLVVSNQIYKAVFNTVWTEEQLELAQKYRIIQRRYKLVEELKKLEIFKIYRAVDMHVPSRTSYILQEFSPQTEDVSKLAEIDKLLEGRFALEKINDYPQIPKLVASFAEEQKFYIVQEFIQGQNLDTEIRSDKIWNEDSVIRLLISVLEALALIHGQDLAHLNLKPSNLRRKDGQIYLIDFGIFKEINRLIEGSNLISSMTTNLLDYEPLPSDKGRSPISRDLYAVGMIGIQALTGTPPNKLNLDSADTNEILWRYLADDKANQKINDKLAKILDRLVQRNPVGRYSDATEVLVDLRQLQRELQQSQQYSWIKKMRSLGVVANLGILGLALGISAIAYQGYQQTIARQEWEDVQKTCNTPITSSSSNNRNLVNGDLAFSARDVIVNCDKVIGQDSNNITALKNRGKAKLLLWKHSLILGQVEQADGYLRDALRDFTSATELQVEDPQALFYKGLAEKLSKLPIHEESYRSAMGLYLSRDSKALTEEDFPVLVTIGSFLLRSPDYAQDDVEKANQLFELASKLNSDSSSIVYNHGSFNARAGNYRDAIQIFNIVIDKDINNQNPRSRVSAAFAYILLGKVGFPDALQSLEEALKIAGNSTDARYLKMARDYRSRLQACLSRSASPSNQNQANGETVADPCFAREFTRDALQASFDEIFPIAPAYKCSEYPVLAIAESTDAPSGSSALCY